MYDPFARGRHPVGVKSDEIRDAARSDRRIALEIWYPAHPQHAGQDLDKDTQDRYPILGGFQVRQEAVRDAAPAEGPFPLVLFSHGFAGHRRQSTFFCTHLASHGYVVIAMDHGGNTLADMVALAMNAGSAGIPRNFAEILGSYVFDRPRDVSFVLDALERGAVRDLPLEIDVSRVGMSGHSFGGWTTLVASGRDARIVAALPLAPAGGPGPLTVPALADELRFSHFSGRVDTLYLALARDTLLPLDGIATLFRKTPPPARMIVLDNADHMHVCDRVERSHEFFRTMPQLGPMAAIARNLPPMSELVPGEHGYLFASGLGTAHMDAVLKHHAAARELRDHGVEALRQRGVIAHEITR